MSRIKNIKRPYNLMYSNKELAFKVRTQMLQDQIEEGILTERAENT